MSKEVAKNTDTGLPVSSGLLSEIMEHGGLGFSERAEDKLIPILAILQDNSAEVKKKHDKYIEGAEAGMLIVRSLGLVFKSETPEEAVLFQPCAFQHMWVEWEGEPGDGAVVGQYPFDDLPKEAKEVTETSDDGSERKVWKMPSGTRLVDTRYHFGHLLVADEVIPVVVPMAGTNHTISRGWTAQMDRFRIPGTERKLPAFFRAYQVMTSFVQRGAQSWYKYKIQDFGMIEDEAVVRAGFELMKSVAEEKVTAAVTEITEDEATDNTDAPI